MSQGRQKAKEDKIYKAKVEKLSIKTMAFLWRIVRKKVPSSSSAHETNPPLVPTLPWL